jgi:hypothetical protein
MANYFNFFPKTYYAPTLDTNSVDVVTNLVTRFSFEKKFKENTSVFTKYNIDDGDTPEIIAYKAYGSAELHWVVLAMNDIVDPQYDFPLDQRTLTRFIDAKYTENANTTIGQTGLTWAKTNIHSYYTTKTSTNISTGDYSENVIEIDASTYANTTATTTTITAPKGIQYKVDIAKSSKTYYDYEIEYNETKRTINLLKPEYINAVKDELKRVLGVRVYG